MPTTNSAVYNAYGKKKRNSLAPYLDAGNSSVSGNMQLTTPQPTGGNTRLYNAYAGTGTQPKATTKVARAYSSAVTPADTAYRSATSPAAANPTQAQYQPGEILRRSAANGNANNAQPAAAAADQTGVVSAPAAQSTGAAQTGGQTALQRAYGSQNSSGNTYGADRQNAINAATASYNKLLNYLPEYNELMGMRGLGVSEQALLNAQRDYAQNIADINATYDEMEQAYRDTQISNVNTLSAELSAYINDAGENFTQEGYERFKQGMLQAGYTAEELAAAENLLTQADLDSMQNALDVASGVMNSAMRERYRISGSGLDTTIGEDGQEGDDWRTRFGAFAGSLVDGKQNALVKDILNAAQQGRISNGTFVNFNYGGGDGGIYVYINGLFYPTSYSEEEITSIVGRGADNRIDPNTL